MEIPEDDMEVAGIAIGTAVPNDRNKEIYVALKVKDAEVYISSIDARDVAKSLIECCEYVDHLNKERTIQ